MKRSMFGWLLVFCIFLDLGCGTPDPNRLVHYKHLKVVPGAVRTVCIQPDPAQPEMALIVKPLKEKLTARGYQIVATPDEAAHTLRLHLNVFGVYGTASEAKKAAVFGSGTAILAQGGPRMAPGVGAAAGTAIGGAVSGNALHAATTTGGAVGGIAGVVLGSLLSVGDPNGPFFYADMDVRISDPVSGEQHTVRGNTWKLFKDPSDPKLLPMMQQIAADDLANKIAELMP